MAKVKSRRHSQTSGVSTTHHFQVMVGTQWHFSFALINRKTVFQEQSQGFLPREPGDTKNASQWILVTMDNRHVVRVPQLSLFYVLYQEIYQLQENRKEL